MSGSFEKSVKGGTKIKLAPPKAKYVEHILVATHAGEGGVAEIFRALQNRLRDSTWTIVFKSLIIVHLMIREGEPNVTLRYLADHPSRLAISNFSDVQVQGTNIRHYYSYILARAKSYKETRVDWVREGVGRLKKQTVDKGLLRETEAVQSQIGGLLKCDLLSAEAENEITVCAFRLLTMDLLVLYGVMNEGTINILEHYFEMSKTDAQRALAIYKNFSKQTNLVVEYLGMARRFEHATRLEIPKLKHAPTSLTASLQEYLNDPDFEVNRRQYLAHQGAKKGKGPIFNSDGDSSSAFKSQALNSGAKSTKAADVGAAQSSQAKAAIQKSPAPDLIDFFDSIEQNQQPMAISNQLQASTAQQGAPMGYVTQQPQFAQGGAQISAQPTQNTFMTGNNLFGQPQQQQQQPLQQNPNGASFGGFAAQQPFLQQQNSFPVSGQPSNSFPNVQAQPNATGMNGFASAQQPFATGQSQPQASNPFHQSMYAQATGASLPAFSPTQSNTTGQLTQNTNPFARSATTPATMQNPNLAFSQSTGQTQFSQPTGQTQFFSSPPPMQNNTPFASPPPHEASQIMPQRTGTNPFARVASPPQPQASGATMSQVATNQTGGGTNPFRQSMFVNQQTGQGWQSGQGTMGGLEQVPTIPVFPRPAGQ